MVKIQKKAGPLDADRPFKLLYYLAVMLNIKFNQLFCYADRKESIKQPQPQRRLRLIWF